METDFTDRFGLPCRLYTSEMKTLPQLDASGPDIRLMIAQAAPWPDSREVPCIDDLSGLVLILVPQPGKVGADFEARFGLTRAEAEVARCVAAGQRTAEIARARGTSEHTVRNQIKSAMEKCGVARQLDLARIVLAQDG